MQGKIIWSIKIYFLDNWVLGKLVPLSEGQGSPDSEFHFGGMGVAIEPPGGSRVREILLARITQLDDDTCNVRHDSLDLDTKQWLARRLASANPASGSQRLDRPRCAGSEATRAKSQSTTMNDSDDDECERWKQRQKTIRPTAITIHSYLDSYRHNRRYTIAV